MATDWKPLSTAPRDGTLIRVRDDEEEHVMRWNPIGSNPLVQSEPTGIWEACDGSYTWSEQTGFPPTHWAHITEPDENS